MPLSLEMFNHLETKPSQEDLEYFNLLSFERLDNTASWITTSFLCYCFYDDVTGFKIWSELSKLSNKYDSNIISYTWKQSILNKPKRMSNGSFLHFAAIDNKDESDKLNKKYSSLINFIQDDPFLDDSDDNIFINQGLSLIHI